MHAETFYTIFGHAYMVLIHFILAATFLFLHFFSYFMYSLCMHSIIKLFLTKIYKFPVLIIINGSQKLNYIQVNPQPLKNKIKCVHVHSLHCSVK